MITATITNPKTSTPVPFYSVPVGNACQTPYGELLLRTYEGVVSLSDRPWTWTEPGRCGGFKVTDLGAIRSISVTLA